MTAPVVVLNRPIYQRIGRRDPPRPLQAYIPDQMSYSPTEGDRIWKLVRQCAEGTNPVPVDQSGWDAA